jgi:uncharacterized membrane protein YczE
MDDLGRRRIFCGQSPMRYFTNLEFYADRTELGHDLQTRRNLLVALMYLLLSLGIFAHEAIGLSPLSVRPVHWSTLGASFIVGLALLPPAIRWINIRKRNPSWEQVLTAFSVGFFIDLTNKQVLGQIWKLISH